jgi:hypothetical protein
MKIKTSELTGAALDWAVAKAADYLSRMGDHWMVTLPGVRVRMNFVPGPRCSFSPSTRWAQSGPIIEQEHIEWQWLPAPDKAHQYGARKPSLGGLNRTFCVDGPTVLVAAMRCFVASKLGDEVEIPKEFN